MARPTPVKVSVSTTQAQVNAIDPTMPFRAIHIKNIGATDCFVDFDTDIDANNSYVLESGETLSLDWPFKRLTHKTSSGSTTLHIIKI